MYEVRKDKKVRKIKERKEKTDCTGKGMVRQDTNKTIAYFAGENLFFDSHQNKSFQKKKLLVIRRIARPLMYDLAVQNCEIIVTIIILSW